MQFSLRTLAGLVAWCALVLTLLCQIRLEAMRPQWTSQVPAGVILLANTAFALFAVLTALSTIGTRRIFWIGCAIVASALTVGQVFDLKPPGIAGNAAWLLGSTLLPNETTHTERIYRAGHMVQLESVLIYSLIPPLALLGGWYTRRTWIQSHRRPGDPRPS